MSNDMSDATKKVLKQQLGSVLTKEKPQPSPRYTPTTVTDYSGYGYTDDDYYSSSYGDSFAGSNYYEDDESYAEDLIKKMEMDPAQVVRVVDEESVSTLVDVITLLLYR